MERQSIEDFMNKLQERIFQNILNRADDLIKIDYYHRPLLPNDIIREAWEKVDKDKLIQEIAKNIEKRMAEKIVNSIAAEISTDIKQVLSVKERREEIRSKAREIIKEMSKKS
jgi:cobalamin biosynthesis protein CbiD